MRVWRLVVWVTACAMSAGGGRLIGVVFDVDFDLVRSLIRWNVRMVAVLAVVYAALLVQRLVTSSQHGGYRMHQGEVAGSTIEVVAIERETPR